MPSYSGTVTIWVSEDGVVADPQYFAGTTVGLQAAIDSLAGGKGVVHIGAGTLETDNEVSVHSGCHIKGSGTGVTIIKRASGSFIGTSPGEHADIFISTAYGSNGTLSLAPTRSRISASPT